MRWLDTTGPIPRIENKKTHGQVGLAHVFLRGLFFWLSLQAQLTAHSRIRRRSNRRPTEAADS